METALILSQTLFYFVVSTAIMVLGVLFAIVIYHLINIAKELEKISNDFHDISGEAKERLREIIERLSELPILSYFLKRPRYPEKPQRKGRRNN
ncbi:MAG: hypothetical protein Q7S36_00540 [Candidatus Liptonbacteria bacterium]|nr:hypothetical protein [Candidatus Liptonbacteria bacterium]